MAPRLNRESTISLLSRALGGVFIISGVGKIFTLASFSAAISEIVQGTSFVSNAIAAILIATEILGGIALIVGFMVRRFSLFFCVLLSVFLWVLSSAVAQGREINCACFGVFNLGLTNRSEILLDLALFNCFSLLIYLTSSPLKQTTRKFWSIAMAGVFLVAQVVFAWIVDISKLTKLPLQILPAITYAELHNQEFTKESRNNRLLLLLNLQDLECSSCSADLFALCDAIKSRYHDEQRRRFLVLFKSKDPTNAKTSIRLSHWMKANELPFPFLAVPESVFEEVNCFKTSVVVIGPSGIDLFSGVIPIGGRNRQAILQLL